MYTLSEQEEAQLTHSPKPIEYLVKLGLSQEEAGQCLWAFSVREGASYPPMQEHLKALRLCAKTATHTQLIQMVNGLNASADLPEEHYRAYMDFLNQLSGRKAHEVAAGVSDLDTPCDGYLAVLALEDGTVKQVEDQWLAAITQLFFHGFYLFGGSLEVLEDYRERMNLSAWHKLMWEAAQTQEITDGYIRRFPWEVLATASDEELIAFGLAQRSTYEVLTEELVKRGAGIIEKLEAEILPLRGEESNRPHGVAFLPAYMQLLQQEQLAVPEAFDEWMHYFLRGGGFAYYREDLPGVFQMLSQERALGLIEAHGDQHLAVELFSFVEDNRALAPIMASLHEREPTWYELRNYPDALAKGGPRIVEVLLPYTKLKTSANFAIILVRTLAQIDTEASDKGLVFLLAHSSKLARNQAVEVLAKRGERALAVLEQALLARRKATREAGLAVFAQSGAATEAKAALAAEVLAQTKDATVREALEAFVVSSKDDEEAGTSDPLQEVYALEQAIDDELRSSLSELARGWRRLPQKERATQLDVLGVRALLVAPGDEYYAKEIWQELCQRHLEEPLAPWIVCYMISQASEAKGRQVTRGMTGVLPLLKEDALDALVTFALQGNNQKHLLDALVRLSPERSVAVLVEALQSTRKLTKEVARNYLLELGGGALGEDVASSLAPLLSSKKKSLRLKAVDLLRLLNTKNAMGALEQAHKSEKNADVKAAIKSALAVLDPGHTNPLEDASHQELEAFLGDIKLPSLPKALAVEVLPPLLWSSGEPLSDQAQQGWLALVAKEKPKHPNPDARVIREHLDRATLAHWSESLFEQWKELRPPSKYRWMVDQLSIGASPDFLYRAGFFYNRPFEESFDFSLAYHGSRLAARLLHVRYASSKKAKAANEEAKAVLPETLRPTPEEQTAFWVERRMAEYRWFGEPGATQRLQREHYSCVLQLQMLPLPEMGALPEGYDVVLVGFSLDQDVDPTLTNTLFREAEEERKELFRDIRGVLHQLRKELDPVRERPLMLSDVGWRLRLRDDSLRQMFTMALLFRTEQGQLFMQSPEGQPVDEKGEVIQIESDSFLTLVDPATLSATQQKRWEARWEELKPGWSERLLTAVSLLDELDPMSELRELLYASEERDVWGEVLALFDAWPQPDTLELAISYLQSHADEQWEGFFRGGLEHWSHALLSVEHATRRSSKLTPETIPFYQSLLKVCDKLRFGWIILKVPDMKAMAQSKHLSHIKSLELNHCTLGRGVSKRLATEVSLPSLEEMTLIRTTVTPKELTKLFMAPWWHTIKSLRLLESKFTWELMEELLQEERLASLRALDVRDNPLQLPGIQAIAKAPQLAQLRTLRLSYEGVSDEGLLWLIAHNPFAELETLHIELPYYQREESYASIEALAHSDRFPRLKRISLLSSEHHTTVDDTLIPWVECLLASKQLPQEALDYLRRTHKPHQEAIHLVDIIDEE